MTVATSWGVKVDEPNIGAFKYTSSKVMRIQCYNLFIIIIDTKIIVVVIPGLILKNGK